MKKEKYTYKKIFKFFRKNSIWMIAVFTAVLSLFAGLFRFIEYIRFTVLSEYYDFDINLCFLGDTNYLFYIIKMLFGSVSFYIVSFCMYKLRKKGKIFSKDSIINTMYMLVSNYILSIYLLTFYGWITNALYSFVLYLIELIVIKVFILMDKKSNSSSFVNQLEKAFSDISIVIICFTFTFILIFGYVIFITNFQLREEKEYRIIDNNKVIVYSNNDYYVTLRCDIDKDNIIIYKGKQEKILTDNAYTEKMKFKEVVLK